MSKRIGELLVEKKLITPLQLDKALKTQLIVGGHLGTCLLELDFIEEAAFGRALAGMHGLRYASPERLDHVPPPVTRALSAKVAAKYHAVPILLEDDTLHVAVVDPKNLGRLSSSTGYRIVPWIAPELRVFEALERYYGIPRSERQVRACNMRERRQDDERRARDKRGGGPGEAEPDAAAQMGETASPHAAPATTPQDLGADYGYGRSWRDVADELFRLEDPDEAAADRPERPTGGVASPNDGGSPNLYQRMSRAESKDDLARVVLQYAAQKMTGAILFVVKSEIAMVWDWTGLKLPANARSLRFPVTSGAIFTLMLGDGAYRGAVPRRNEVRWFYNALQLDVPEEILLLPVYLEDRLVAIFYGDGGPTGEIRGSDESYERLARKLGQALHMLVLKLKICS